MRIKGSEKRRKLTKLRDRGEFHLLEILGVNVIDDSCTPSDCAGFVAHQLGLQGRLDILRLLDQQPELETPQEGCIVTYSIGDIVRHYGLFRSGRVISKWNDKGPIVKHTLEDVPSDYGNGIKFKEVNGDLFYKAQLLLQGVDPI
ncbi:hypothetical protein ACFLZN_00610 [Nanoarchaeota archaeon]